MQSIKISDSTYKALKNEAKKRGCFMSRVIDDAVAKYFLFQIERVLAPKGKK